MLFILAILYSSNNSRAAPLLLDTISPGLNSLRIPSQCLCPDQQRSFWDILWSCLATIFACTWVSVHPNIPPSGENWWKTGLRRLELMFWALIAPEMIIYWAMSQWCGARAMVEKYQGHGWTKTHAYFIQMGGFTLFKGGKPQEVLLPQRMEELLLHGQIDLPQITETEIRDRSKGDGLSKALVIGQTSWFVAQCVARRAQGLILTELELVTAAFAVLNGVMYFLWWNKPLDVRCSVPVHLLDEVKPIEERFEFKSTENPAFSIRHAAASCYHPLIQIVASSVTGIRKSTRKSMNSLNRKTAQTALTTIIILPWATIRGFFSRLDDIYRPGSTLKVFGSVSTVSTFYASADYTTGQTDNLLIPSVTSTIGALFGGLHCIAWFFTFPSHVELIIWHFCSALILVVPLGTLFFFMAYFRQQKAEADSASEKVFGIITKIFSVSLYCLPIYAIARLLLLGEAFVALRYLAPDALAVVNWLSFLPHI